MNIVADRRSDDEIKTCKLGNYAVSADSIWGQTRLEIAVSVLDYLNVRHLI